MAKLAAFSEDAGRRIADATRFVESLGADARMQSGLARKGTQYREEVYRVDATVGAGEYTLWQQKWNTESHEFEDIAYPDGYAGESAWEMRGAILCPGGVLVRGWKLYWQDTPITDPPTGRPYLFFEIPKHVFWGKATSNWANATHPAVPYVNVNPSSNRLGAEVDTDTSILVYLPRCGDEYSGSPTPTWHTGWDPNICAGDIIGYSITSDGSFVCVSGYLQPKIGCAMWWVLPSDEYGTVDEGLLPPGWEIVDDAKGKFVVAWYSATGKTLNAADSATYYKKLAETGGFDLHGIDENGHPHHWPHGHPIALTVPAAVNGAALYVIGKPLSPGTGYTGGAVTCCPMAPAGCSLTFKHGGGLHAWTESGYEEHPKNDTDNRPEYIVYILMKRVDNSAT